LDDSRRRRRDHSDHFHFGLFALPFRSQLHKAKKNMVGAIVQPVL
jgi:hypothetical protein